MARLLNKMAEIYKYQPATKHVQKEKRPELRLAVIVQERIPVRI